MRKRIAFITIFVIGIATGLFSSDVFAFHAPFIGGKWWQRPAVKESIQLTPDQVSTINTIWMKYKKRIIDLKSELDKAYLDLESLMDKPELSKEAAYTLGEKIAGLQANQIEERIKMAIEIRGELSVEQFQRLKDLRRELSKRRRDKRMQEDRRAEPKRE